MSEVQNQNQRLLEEVQSVRSLIETKDKEKAKLEADLLTKDQELKESVAQIKSVETEKVTMVQAQEVSSAAGEEQKASLNQKEGEIAVMKSEIDQLKAKLDVSHWMPNKIYYQKFYKCLETLNWLSLLLMFFVQNAFLYLNWFAHTWYVNVLIR